MSSIAVIVITYNSSHFISKCLRSVSENASGKFRLFFVLIDNNSSDSSIEIIKDLENEDCIVVSNKKNIGFANAVNQGIKLAKKNFSPDHYLLLNPDATLHNNALDQLLHYSKQNENSLCSPLIIDQKNKGYWFCGAQINWINQKSQHLTKPQNNTEPYQSDILSGCCLWIPKDLAEKIGSFDERFYLYYEDADYCIRANKLNITSLVIPTAICYHTESQSSTTETKCRHLVKSGLLFFHKHSSWYFKVYFWITFYARFFYHNLITHKSCVIRGMKDFQKQKNLPKTHNSI